MIIWGSRANINMIQARLPLSLSRQDLSSSRLAARRDPPLLRERDDEHLVVVALGSLFRLEALLTFSALSGSIWRWMEPSKQNAPTFHDINNNNNMHPADASLPTLSLAWPRRRV